MKTPVCFTEVDREKRLAEWAAATGIKPGSLDSAQRAVIFAALAFLSFTGPKVFGRRFQNSGGENSRPLRTARSVVPTTAPTTVELNPNSQCKSRYATIRRNEKAKRGHAPPKLRREQVGLVARYIAEHKQCSVAELLAFIKSELGVVVDRLTLRRFLKRYGLGHLREESVAEPPLLSGGRRTEALSHCS